MAGWFAHTLRPAMLAAGRSDRLGRIVERSPLTRGVVRRFVPGDTLDDVVDIVTALRDSGRYLSIDYLGENVTDADDAAAAVRAYLGLLDVLGRRGDIACDGVRPLEVSLKLSALGQALDRDGQKIALDNARAICERAERVGAWVTVDAEDHTTTDSTLSISAWYTDLDWPSMVAAAIFSRHGPANRSAARRNTAARSSNGSAAQSLLADMAASTAAAASAWVALVRVPSLAACRCGCTTSIRSPSPIRCRPPMTCGRSMG